MFVCLYSFDISNDSSLYIVEKFVKKCLRKIYISRKGVQKFYLWNNSSNLK